MNDFKKGFIKTYLLGAKIMTVYFNLYYFLTFFYEKFSDIFKKHIIIYKIVFFIFIDFGTKILLNFILALFCIYLFNAFVLKYSYTNEMINRKSFLLWFILNLLNIIALFLLIGINIQA